MVLVRERGRAMADAAARTPTGMTAVLGGDAGRGARRARASTASPRPTTTAPARSSRPAPLEQLAAFAGRPAGQGAGCIPLSVAGAFHTEHMAPAVGRLGALRRAPSATHDPRTRLISNRDGAVVHDGREVLRPHRQPGRATRCAGTCACGPWASSASPASSSCRRPARSTGPGQAGAARRRDRRAQDPRRPRGGPRPGRRGTAARARMDDSPTWRLLVAPSQGHVPHRRRCRHRHACSSPGTAVGTLVTSRDEQPVVAPHGGTVVEWLVEDGDPVAPGQPHRPAAPRGGAAA